MAQVHSSQPLTAVASVGSHFNPGGICCGQNGAGTCSFTTTYLNFPVSVIPAILHTHISFLYHKCQDTNRVKLDYNVTKGTECFVPL
jgi:hypothetical protein